MNDESETRRLLSRAIHEALEAYVTSNVSQSLLREALERSSLERPPSSPSEAELFLNHGLMPVATQALGSAMAESILEEIGRTVELITRRQTRPVAPRRGTPVPPVSGRRTTPRHTRPRAEVSTAPVRSASLTPSSVNPRSEVRRQHQTAPVTARGVSPGGYFRDLTAAPAEPLQILALTQDPQLLSALASVVGDSGSLRAVRNVFGLVRAVDGAGGHRVFVLLDGAMPSIGPLALAALADELLDVTVVLCRTSVGQDAMMAEISPATRRWTRLSDSRDPLGVAADCARLVS
jgi:hypothetical protein